MTGVCTLSRISCRFVSVRSSSSEGFAGMFGVEANCEYVWNSVSVCHCVLALRHAASLRECRCAGCIPAAPERAPVGAAAPILRLWTTCRANTGISRCTTARHSSAQQQWAWSRRARLPRLPCPGRRRNAKAVDQRGLAASHSLSLCCRNSSKSTLICRRHARPHPHHPVILTVQSRWYVKVLISRVPRSFASRMGPESQVVEGWWWWQLPSPRRLSQICPAVLLREGCNR